MTEQVRIWARVVRGLEWIVAAEASRLPQTHTIEIAHRDVSFTCGDPTCALTLRCADDAYVVWFEIAGLDHTRAALAKLAEAAARYGKEPPITPSNARHLRVTASFAGRRNYSRFEIEDTLGPILAKRLGLTYVETAKEVSDHAFWCRVHLFEKNARIGLRIGAEPLHRRPWRTQPTPGALHPPIAAAMAMLADLAHGQDVYDPFAGSGTLLIEAGLLCPNLHLEGADASAEAVSKATGNARAAGVPVQFKVMDAFNLARQNADRILSNPPWGVTVEAQGLVDRSTIVPTLLAGIRPGGRLVLIGDRDLDLPARTQAAGANLHLAIGLRTSGRLADIVVTGGESRFGATSLGAQLSHYWSKRQP